MGVSVEKMPPGVSFAVKSSETEGVVTIAGWIKADTPLSGDSLISVKATSLPLVFTKRDRAFWRRSKKH